MSTLSELKARHDEILARIQARRADEALELEFTANQKAFEAETARLEAERAKAEKRLDELKKKQTELTETALQTFETLQNTVREFRELRQEQAALNQKLGISGIQLSTGAAVMQRLGEAGRNIRLFFETKSAFTHDEFAKKWDERLKKITG